jgi:hypothetical protein
VASAEDLLVALIDVVADERQQRAPVQERRVPDAGEVAQRRIDVEVGDQGVDDPAAGERRRGLA